MTALDELRKLDDAATPGPWVAQEALDGWDIEDVAQFPCCESWGEDKEQRKAQGKHNAQLASLSHLLRPAFEALLGELPINGRGECDMFACGSVPDGEGLHFDADNIWGGDRPCFQGESYDGARAVLAKLEEALK